MAMPISSTASRYDALVGLRDPYLKRGQDCAKLTIPSLLPESRSSTNKLPTPWQGIGARGVNNLASKLLLALVPPNSPFFRFMVDPFTLDQMSQDPNLRTAIEKGLGKVERAIMSEIETSGDRVQLFEALKHLIVAGNVLLFIGKEGLKVYHLDKYVVKRDSVGNVLEIITKEYMDVRTLPERVQTTIRNDSKDGDQKSIALYTKVLRGNNEFRVHQEVNGVVVPGSQGHYPIEKAPWLALRFVRIDGEDYGRSYVDEYYGDLHSLEKLTKAIVEGSAAAAKVLFLVDPNGSTKQKTLAQAPNGAVRTGSMEDISVLQIDKFADFRVTLETMQRIEERIAYAFLLNSSVQRKGERVTAEEIRYMAGELEDALGGVYSILSMEMQLPYVTVRMHQMQKQGRLPSLPKKVVKPTIVTGLEALGRGHDLRKLDLFLQGLKETLGPEALQMYLNIDDYIARRATAVGLETEGLIKTKQEIEQAQQQQQMQAYIQQFGPEALKQAGGLAQAGMKQNVGN